MVEFLLLFIGLSIGIVCGYILRVRIARTTGIAGTILVTETEDRKVFSLELNIDPNDLEDEDEVIFRVSEHPSVREHASQ